MVKTGHHQMTLPEAPGGKTCMQRVGFDSRAWLLLFFLFFLSLFLSIQLALSRAPLQMKPNWDVALKGSDEVDTRLRDTEVQSLNLAFDIAPIAFFSLNNL